MVVWLHEFPCIQASTVSFGEEPEDPENKKKKKEKKGGQLHSRARI